MFVDIRNFNGFSIAGICVIALGSIIINTISRMAGVFVNIATAKKLPLDMLKSRFTIFFIWAGLKGGLSLALVMETASSFSPVIDNLFLISTYAIVLFTTVFQGLTVGKAYQKLK